MQSVEIDGTTNKKGNLIRAADVVIPPPNGATGHESQFPKNMLK